MGKFVSQYDSSIVINDHNVLYKIGHWTLGFTNQTSRENRFGSAFA